MVIRFTLITEGVSENRVIKHILTKYFKGNELFFRDAQPQIITGTQNTPGGWNEVLKYCQRSEDLKEIFLNTDYLVIQIDTDQSQTAPFSISHSNLENKAKNPEELYKEVVEKITGLIDAEVWADNNKKIIFAICVHTIECWLLPIYYHNSHKSDTLTCLPKLNSELKKKNISPINLTKKNQFLSIRAYETVLKNWNQKNEIINHAQNNAAFKRFVDSLGMIGSLNEQ